VEQAVAGEGDENGPDEQIAHGRGSILRLRWRVLLCRRRK
jgi:hypothetical protein